MKFICIILFMATFVFGVDAGLLYKKCSGCHGQDGLNAPFAKKNGIIAGRDELELQPLLRAIKAGSYKDNRISKIMQKAISAFSEEDIVTISSYISKLK